jgi:hypothetical protein
MITTVPVGAAEYILSYETTVVNEDTIKNWEINTELVTDARTVRLEVNLTVINGSAVDLLLFDVIGFLEYQYSYSQGTTFDLIVDGSEFNVDDTAHTSIDLPNGTYYVVVENAVGVGSGATPTGLAWIHIVIKIFHNEQGSNPLGFLSTAPYLLPLLAVPVAVVIIIIYQVRKWRRKKKWKPVFKRKA